MQPAAQRQAQRNFTAHPKRKPPRAAKAQMRHSMVLLQAACQQCMPLSICALSSSTPAVLDDQNCDCPACAKALLRICTASKGPMPWVALGQPSAQPADSVMLPTHKHCPNKAQAAYHNPLPAVQSLEVALDGFTTRPDAASPAGPSGASQ